MEFTGKTVEEATILGLNELGIKEEDAVITVVKQPVKGLFGRIKSNAVVDIEKKEKKENKKAPKQAKEDQKEEKLNLKKAQEIVDEIFKYLDFNTKTTITEGENPTINVIAEKSSEVIGFRGEVLDSLQVIASAVANMGNKSYKKVVVDCENYRLKREDTLIALAKKLELKATDMRREVMLEPMQPFERRIIHTALADSSTVTTRSEGVEPNRYVVIVPNDKDEYSKPYNAGRNNGRSQNKHNSFKGKDRDNRSQLRKKQSGFTEQKKIKPSGFGTYLGNSLKDSK